MCSVEAVCVHSEDDAAETMLAAEESCLSQERSAPTLALARPPPMHTDAPFMRHSEDSPRLQNLMEGMSRQNRCISAPVLGGLDRSRTSDSIAQELDSVAGDTSANPAMAPVCESNLFREDWTTPCFCTDQNRSCGVPPVLITRARPRNQQRFGKCGSIDQTSSLRQRWSRSTAGIRACDCALLGRLLSITRD